MIKIDQPFKLNTPKRPERSKSSSASGSGFSNLLDSIDAEEETTASRPATQVSAPSSLNSMSALLSAQAISEEMVHRQKQVRHANLTLDSLEELRYALLMGTVPVYLLANIEKRMSEIKQHDLPETLRNVIEEVELRAAVELAKFRMQR